MFGVMYIIDLNILLDSILIIMGIVIIGWVVIKYYRDHRVKSNIYQLPKININIPMPPVKPFKPSKNIFTIADSMAAQNSPAMRRARKARGERLEREAKQKQWLLEHGVEVSYSSLLKIEEAWR